MHLSFTVYIVNEYPAYHICQPIVRQIIENKCHLWGGIFKTRRHTPHSLLLCTSLLIFVLKKNIFLIIKHSVKSYTCK